LAERREVVLAAQLDTPTRSRLAVTKELGASGARLLSMGRFQPGEVVVLWMLVAGTHSKVRAEGRVVRAEPFNVSGPWRCLLTVDFDEPLDEESAALLLSGDPGE
jgi:hypothetical protein